MLDLKVRSQGDVSVVAARLGIMQSGALRFGILLLVRARHILRRTHSLRHHALRIDALLR